jgi:DNA-directed RNA polymerase subunit F
MSAGENLESLTKLKQEIAAFMSVERFLEIHRRLAELKAEEEQKLAFLAELQKSYIAAGSDLERDKVKETVGKIRELSKIAREEIRGLNQQINDVMPIEKARDFYKKYLELI